MITLNTETTKTIEGFLLVGFLSLQQIADRVGVTFADVDKVMMEMELPYDWNEE